MILESVLGEIERLGRHRTLWLPPDPFVGVPDKVVAAWRSRAAAEYPSDLRDRPRPVQRCVRRSGDLTDSLVALLLGMLLKIHTKGGTSSRGWTWTSSSARKWRKTSLR